MTTPRLDRTQVSIPADASHLDVLRLVVRNACARRSASLDEIDDAALAVHEAAIALVDAGSKRLTMEIDNDADQLVAIIASGEPIDLMPDDSMPFRIIEALTDDHAIDTHDGVTTIRLTLRVGGEDAPSESV